MIELIANSTDNILNNHTIKLLDEEQQQINDWLDLVAKQQDKRAFSQLFTFFAPRIRSHGLKKFRQEAQAMELVQETMMLVWRKACQFNADKGKASTWIYTIMRNYSFDMLRKVQSNKEDLISEDLWPMLDVEEDTDEQDHLQSRHLLSYINTLPTLQKQVVEGIYIEDKTQQELADELSVPVGTIKSRLRLAMIKLRDMMEDKS
ncbi:sigma-70 family RNA polymerase sigma factor [Psychromonas sp. Urea-02u-13]|uniref:sigma-70 family RNA polymerase sigma factor n=1 Tax=Psychromonas sp. Urea-02u-13 TaxID=2058326 RepID=UPI000C34294C|nr:sigma-70 family RNA polymerase sigma factor [Psychromonas sp. Urea-02u-13]PKG38472.1 RNA polymerase subunit sigma [Psychromonas sp. Urea-02u-13]